MRVVGRTARLGILFVTALLFCGAAFGLSAMGPSGNPGLVQRVGADIPGDVIVTDDGGRSFPLVELFDKPAILSLVYFKCTHYCPQVQVGLSGLVPKLGSRLGRDYRIVTLSFDEMDGTSQAAEARRNYTYPLGPDLPAGAWTFVTASKGDIARLTSTLGFTYKGVSHGFIHPVVLVLLAPGGRVSRYVLPSKYNYGAAYPILFSPIEFRQYLDQAGRGSIAGPSPGPLLFCFESEPLGQASYYRMTTVLGFVTLACLALLFAYLSVVRRRP